jgi:hypothetical protein
MMVIPTQERPGPMLQTLPARVLLALFRALLALLFLAGAAYLLLSTQFSAPLFVVGMSAGSTLAPLLPPLWWFAVSLLVAYFLLGVLSSYFFRSRKATLKLMLLAYGVLILGFLIIAVFSDRRLAASLEESANLFLYLMIPWHAAWGLLLLLNSLSSASGTDLHKLES